MSDLKRVEELKSICKFNYELNEDGFCIKISFYDENHILKNTIRNHPDKEKIVKTIAMFPKLRHVNLRKCRVGFFPKFESQDIEYLDVSCNDIEKIPNLDLINLFFFNCGSNNIETLPDLIHMPLLVFKAHKNPLKEIPSLPNSLETLNLFLSYKLKRMPSFIYDLKKLRHFTLSCFDLSRNDFYVNFRRLEWLSLSYCNIHSLSNSTCSLENLKGLILSKNNIKKLPKEIGSLVELKYLSLYKNNIAKVPDSFFKLNLKKLSLEHNCLSDECKNKLFSKYNEIEILKL